MKIANHQINIIELKNVSFSYDNSELVLNNITFAVHQGDYLGIIGPNGGGKTTLLKLMLGLLKPTSGTIKLFGQDIKLFKDWSKIGYVPQKAAYFDRNFPAAVEEVVAMGRYGKRGLFKFLNHQDQQKVHQSLAQVDMLEYKDRRIGDLSGGQQQRVFIARALASEPEVIFLDEPTVGVDIKAQEQFYELLSKLNQTLNLTLILISHELDIVANQTTEVACINHQLVFYTPAKDLLKRGHLEDIYGKELKYILREHTHQH